VEYTESGRCIATYGAFLYDFSSPQATARKKYNFYPNINMTNRTYLLFDIGGTWIKAAAAESGVDGDIISETVKAPSPLIANASVDDLSWVLLGLAEQLKSTPSAIVISTAGVVNYHGSGLEFAAEHLSALVDQRWIKNLKETFHCPVNLITMPISPLSGQLRMGWSMGPELLA